MKTSVYVLMYSPPVDLILVVEYTTFLTPAVNKDLYCTSESKIYFLNSKMFDNGVNQHLSHNFVLEITY